jgi:phosphoribosylaminoimidazolecarboxamide formyltransferase/IMP cyclohydrolase
VDVATVTGFPEMLGGRVKTLHPAVHGGLLADSRDASHVAAVDSHGIGLVEVAAVNLYPFEATVLGGAGFDEVVENIDIGGPAMVRSAAKNHASVAVVVDPADYPAVLAALEDGSIEGVRRGLAAKAFRHTAFYDSLVARHLTEERFPAELTLGWRRKSTLRYGENPHQEAALYLDPFGEPGLARAEQLWGKELSYNNYLDAESAWELACDLEGTACVVVKHGNPCGVAVAGSGASAYAEAKACDPVSAFGGIAAFSSPVDLGAAEAMTQKGNFLEVVVAPGFSPEALEAFRSRSGWGQDVRLLAAPRPPDTPSLAVRSLRGGALVTTTDEDPGRAWQVVSRRQATEAEWAAMRLAWTIVAHVRSNGIVLAQPGRLVGMGAGQPNRVQSVRLAAAQAGAAAQGSALASDAFFPFPDGVEEAAAAGATAVVQPGGSKNDPAVIEAADRLGLAMAFTGTRHFRH